MKTCSKCKILKPLTDYHKESRTFDGLKTACKTCVLRARKNWYLTHKNVVKKHNQIYLTTHPVLASRRQRYRVDISFRKTLIARSQAYRDNSSNKSLICLAAHKKHQRYLRNPHYRMIRSLRRRMLLVLRDKNKSASSLQLVGCDAKTLQEHLESLFQAGMSWNNYGKNGWHIDHKIPCSAFDLTQKTEQEKCFHFSNLQPLWAQDNLRKSNKIPAPNM